MFAMSKQGERGKGDYRGFGERGSRVSK